MCIVDVDAMVAGSSIVLAGSKEDIGGKRSVLAGDSLPFHRTQHNANNKPQTAADVLFPPPPLPELLEFLNCIKIYDEPYELSPPPAPAEAEEWKKFAKLHRRGGGAADWWLARCIIK